MPAFTQAVTTAHQARVTEYGGRIGADEDLPMLLTDTNRLRQYFHRQWALTTRQTSRLCSPRRLAASPCPTRRTTPA